MIDRKEIDLLVRAQLKGGRDLESVTKSILELEKAIESQSAAAKKGEGSIDELKASLLALQQVQERLKGQADLVGTFQRLGEQIAKTEERVKRTGDAYAQYQAKLAKAAEVTDKQQDRLIKLSTASERAQEILGKQRARYDELAASLREAGVATDSLAAAELRIRDSAAQIGVAIANTQNAIESYATDVRKARDAEKQLADEQAFQKKLDDAAKLNRAAEYTNFWIEALDKAELAEKQLADEQAFQKKLDDAAKLAKSSDYVNFWTNALAKAEEAEKELARNKGLSQVADKAQEAAKGYTTLARAATDLSPKTASLKDTIAAIINPAEDARRTIDGVEAEVKKLSATVSAIRGPVRDYQQTLRSLADANRAITSQASLIDDFQRQSAALRAARAEFVAARAKVNEYAAAVRQGGEAGEGFTRSLAEAQREAAAAAQALQKQLSATRESRDALRAAGIATNDLVTAQSRLTSTAQTTVATVNNLAAAQRKYGNEVAATKEKFKFFDDGGRTTLSLMQRIRGEALALIASYVGLQGAISFAGDSVDAFSQREGIRNQLGLSVGNDKKAIDEEYAYVKAQSDRIGIEFDRSSKGYAKFSAAASMAGRDRQEIRYIWESFAEVGRVANLSADDLDGLFKALEQVTSKGKIQAEELRGQIGDRLFGAFEIAAKALKDQFPDLDKAMEKGQVTADQLIRVAEQYRKTVADQLPAATSSLAAQQARLNNAVFDFKLAVADNGWADAYRGLIVEITTFLRSDDGKKAAQQLAVAFSSVADIIVFLLKNLESVQTVLEAVAVLFAFRVAASGVKNISDTAKALKEVSSWLKTAGTEVDTFSGKWPKLATVVKGAFGVMSAAMLGWAVGTWANNEFEVVRKAGISLVTGLDEAWTRIKYGAKILWEEIPRYAKNAFAEVINAATWGTRTTLEIMAKGLDAMGKDELSARVRSTADAMTVRYGQQSEQVKALKQQMESDIEAIRNIGFEMWQDAEKQGQQGRAAAAANASAAASATAFPGVKPGKKGAAADDKEFEKRQSQIEQITRALEALEGKIDRAQTDTLSAQLAAVDVQYAKLARQIGKVGGEAGAEFMARLTESTAQLKTQITAKFNDDLLKDQQALQNKLEDLEAASGKKSKFALDVRLAAIKTSYLDTYRDIDAYRAKLESNNMSTEPADEAKKRLDAGILERQNIERIKFATEELNRLEAQTNDLIGLRNQKLATINAQKATGAITDVQAAEQINRINAEAIPGIQAAAEATRQWALAHGIIFANPEQMDVFVAKMAEIKARAAEAKTEFTDFQQLVGGKGAQAVTSSLDGIADGIEKIVTGQQSVSEGFRDIAASTVGIFAQFFRDIALAILKMMIFNAMKNSGNPYVAAIGSAGAASVGVKHSGGVVGHVSNRSRSVSPAWFATAPRYHGGGIAGLAPDEYATILKKNEEVLTEDSPRNILNGGAGLGGNGKAQNPGMRFVLVDDRANIGDYMRSSDGDQVFVEFLQRNAMTVKSIVGG